ncbi:MAG: SDR family oxidoreductase [Gammaproteobacteria bacterium]|nr:SDR family oxidoreductase [Gammaproteobacteria bacterium]
MKDKVLVLGSAGLIGHQVYNHLQDSDDYELYNISYRNKIQDDTILLSARDEKIFIDTITSIRPHYIVNCIGILINGSDTDPENAVFLNAYMPHRLARLADEIDAKLIHISTDCVFSGDKKEPYVETDEKDGRGVYAKTKGLGEVINDKNLTLRTSVVGPELKTDGKELFHWFMCQQGDISGFTKAIWSGVTTIELAKAVKWSIDSSITGLYHVTNNQSINKHDLLLLFKKYTKKTINILPVDKNGVDKSFVDTRRLINYSIPSYEEMVREMVDMIVDRQDLYKQYTIG